VAGILLAMFISIDVRLVYVPTSSEGQRAPTARKNEYSVMVRMNKNKRLMKNCEAVRDRFAML
jgi:hypothetical protein